MLQADESESHSLNAFVNNLVRLAYLDVYHTFSLVIQNRIPLLFFFMLPYIKRAILNIMFS